MRLIPTFLARPFVKFAEGIQRENESRLLDTTDLGYKARQVYDQVVRLKLLLTLPPHQLWLRRNEIRHPNPAQYI